jgi:hypothetical protein
MWKILFGIVLGATASVVLLSIDVSFVRRSAAQDLPKQSLQELLVSPSRNVYLLGVVRDGRFFIIHPEHSARSHLRLTTVAPPDMNRPEQGLLDLSPYDGKVIMVEGVGQGGWLYAAKVVDQASPIVMALIQEFFAGARVRRLQ